MAKAIPSAADAATRWQQGFAASGQKWAAGIDAVTVAPGQLAAAASSRWLANTQAAANKYAANVAKVSLQQWKSDAVTKGQSRLATGAQVGMAKYQAKIGPVLQAISTIVSGLPPRGTVEQNIQRSSQFQLALHNAFSGQ